MTYQNIIYLIVVMAIAFLFPHCSMENGTKPMKYTKDGIKYSCEAHFTSGEMQKITCFDDQNNIILVDKFRNGVLNDTSIMYYPSGDIKKIGVYANGFRKGVWKEFYQGNKIKRVSIHEFVDNEHYEVYNKVYSPEGELDSVMYNLDISSPDMGRVEVGEKAELDITLNYSEYDSVHLVALLSYDSIQNVFLDTFYSESNHLSIPFIFESTGEYLISGVIIETDKGKYGGERRFEYTFIVEGKN